MIPKLRQLLPKASEKGALANAADEPMPLAVLEFQSPTAAVIATPLPPMARSTTHMLAGLIAILLIIGSTMKLNEEVPGTAVLTSTAPDFTVQAFNSSSILREITVAPGQLVHKGEVVARLDPTYAEADLKGMTEQEQNYAAQVAQLQAHDACRYRSCGRGRAP